MHQVTIGDFVISNESQPFIIAEAGINHNGELDKALAMIDLAKKCGADAVKFQTFRAEEFVGDPEMEYTYYSQGQKVTESMLEMFKRCEFNLDEWGKIKEYCNKQDIVFLSTPQNTSDLELLLDIGMPAIKVGSDDFNNIPLLQNYASKGLPLILSCGMADLSEVYQSLSAVGAFEGHPVILLLCTSQYPTPPEDVNILKLRTLSQAFPMITLGFSDHTQGPLASSLALAIGARVFEKHFTLDHNLPGPDHWFSEDPEGLAIWIYNIRTAYKMMGSAIVRPTCEESINRKEFRRVLTAAKDIALGEPLTSENITLLRSPGGIGLPPSMMQYILGRKAWKEFSKGQAIDI